MNRIILFALLSLPAIAVSWRTLFDPKSHGFYRFLSWEFIIWLFVSNYKLWFHNPFGFTQIISWVFLFISGYLVVAGVILLKKKGKPRKDRTEKTLYHIEKTSQLVDTGIYRFIRHPLYSSLLFLTWGIYFKDVTGFLLIAAILSTASLYLTAKAEEKECITYFGAKYNEYIKRSKMFIPFIV